MAQIIRTQKRFWTLLILSLLSVSFPAFSWGPAAHLHLAERALNMKEPDIWFGAGLPDLNQFVLDNPEAAAAIRYLGHHESERMPANALGYGFISHNEAWGADWYSHQFFLSGPVASSTLYSTRKIVHLSNAFGVTLVEAEFLFEFAIDYLLYQEQGWEIGRKLITGALCFRSEKEMMLVEAFAAPLQEMLPGISYDDAAYEIQNAARLYRTSINAYGAAFMQREEVVKGVLQGMVTMYLGWDSRTAERRLDYAIALCQDDYRAELDRIIRLLRNDMLRYLSDELQDLTQGCFPRQPTRGHTAGFSVILPNALICLMLLGSSRRKRRP